jgi:hypothetical protein
MRWIRYLKLVALLTSLMLTGCASYAPVLVRLNPSGPNVTKAAQGDLTVYVDEYLTRAKSEKAFDTDLANEGVLPLLVLVENGGQQPYEIKAADIVVRGDTPLKALTAEETAERAGRNAVVRALGWSMIVPIISIPVAVVASAVHTNSVNKQIVHDFAAKSFSDGDIMPNKERSGFLFFELPDKQKNLTGLVLEITARNMVTSDLVSITTPLPNVNFTESTPSDSLEGSAGSQR